MIPDFVKKDDISNEFDSIVTDEIFRRSNTMSPTSFSPANLIECPRKLFYQLMEAKPNKKIDYLSQSNDIFVKKKWIEYFKKFQGIKLIEENLVTADCNFNISGTLDAVIQINDTILATQIFVVKASEFLEIERDGVFRKHVIELLIYMWLTEISNGLLIYENRDTHKSLSFHVEPYQPIITSVQKKCLLLTESKLKNQPPDRPYKKVSEECNKCECYKICW